MLAPETTDRIALLRRQIATLEGRAIRLAPETGAQTRPRLRPGEASLPALAEGAASFGIPAVDAVTGGLSRGALHDVLPAGAPDMAAATGFALALAARLVASARRPRPWLWVRSDMARREAGEPYAPGLAALGLDPSRLVSVIAPDGEDVLRAAEEGLAAGAFAVVLIEPWEGRTPVDLTATRRLSLIAAEQGTTGLLLRIAGREAPGSVVTRWKVAAAASRPVLDRQGFGPGGPVFDAELSRNRRGSPGRWPMEWNVDEQRFQFPRPAKPALSRRLVPQPADRPPAAPDAGRILALR